MDFIQTININFDKLTNKDLVKILWKEILNEERSEEYLDQLIEYSFHYPVDSDTYLQELNEKFDSLDKEELRVIDGHLRAYMITFLYYCTNRYNRRVPVKTTMIASGLYLKLISLPEIGKIFFEKNMFKVQLLVCINAAKEESVPDSEKIYLLKLIKQFCLLEKPNLFLLKGTGNTIIGVLMISCRDSVDALKNVQPLPLYCINSIREIIMEEHDNHRLTCILECLFRCLRNNILQSVPGGSKPINVMAIIIRDVLQQELDEDRFQYVLDAFCLIWGREDFSLYDEAAIIMNLFRAQHYKELVRRMMLYTQSKNHKTHIFNVMNLLVAALRNLPTFHLEKVEVFFSCAIRNVILHFIDEDKRIANKAIEVVTCMCLMKDNGMLMPIFNQILSTGKFVTISIEALLLSFKQIMDEKWGTPRNQNLLVIMSKFLAHSYKINNELVQKTLNTICKDCTPFSLKSSLPILHELFCVMAFKHETEVAQAVLKIIFKSAMHQDATSTVFSDHIFKSMLDVSIIDNIIYPPKYYYNIFLTSEFEYEALFTKCYKNIRKEHVEKIIQDLDHEEPGGAVLLCCLLNYCKYEGTNVLAEYFIHNFSEIATRATMGPLSIAFLKILNNKTLTEQDIPQLDVLQSLIMEALFEQTFQVPSIKPAFNLLQEWLHLKEHSEDYIEEK
ncbi:hypothetical protein JTB14_027076 [Gonioctena quinquepunctata]|nr:hypothetical protein JTB14_027076 [Gonioctena quinquepunctata]